MQRAGIGHALFALTLIALSIAGLAQGDFAAIWQPVPPGMPVRAALAYLCAGIALATGAGLLWRRSAAAAAGVLLAWLLLWLLLKGRGIWLAPGDAAAWESAGETAVPAAPAGVLFARFVASEAALRGARTVYGLALIAFGLAHFAYVPETAALVPAWLPWPVAWAYVTGAAYVAAGVAVPAGVLARLAATLSAVQIGLFTLLVWAPPLASGSQDASQWSEAVISWTLTAAAWVVADSYRGTAWLALHRPARE